MELKLLKKKINGFRGSDGSIRNMSPEVLLELRQTWKSFTGSQEQFRSELGIRTGTLRNLLIESVGSETSVERDFQGPTGEGGGMVELSYAGGSKVLRFPGVDSLTEFLRSMIFGHKQTRILICKEPTDMPYFTRA